MTALRLSTLFRITVFSYLIRLLGLDKLKSLIVLPVSNVKFDEKSKQTLILTGKNELNRRIDEELKEEYHALIFTGHSYFCRLAPGRREGALYTRVANFKDNFVHSAYKHSYRYLPDCVYDKDFCYYYQRSIPVSHTSAHQYNMPFIIITNGARILCS